MAKINIFRRIQLQAPSILRIIQPHSGLGFVAAFVPRVFTRGYSHLSPSGFSCLPQSLFPRRLTRKVDKRVGLFRIL